MNPPTHSFQFIFSGVHLEIRWPQHLSLFCKNWKHSRGADFFTEVSLPKFFYHMYKYIVPSSKIPAITYAKLFVHTYYAIFIHKNIYMMWVCPCERIFFDAYFACIVKTFNGLININNKRRMFSNWTFLHENVLLEIFIEYINLPPSISINIFGNIIFPFNPNLIMKHL